ncbi:MAG: pyridoxamine 5'-phosphate oxidase family protein [Promethearchaeota archaeon]
MVDLKEEVKKIIKKNMWLVLSTVNEKDQPHSCVVVYQSDGNIIIVLTGPNTLKVRNIKKNPKVSITIPFRKNFLHKLIPAPPAELHFNATAEIVPKSDEEARRVYGKFLKHAEKSGVEQDSIFVKITPSKAISTFAVGIKLRDMRKPEKARNKVYIK